MLNYIWLGLVLLAVIIGGIHGKLTPVSDRALEMAKSAVLDTALPLVGVMALWLGIMRLAERAGLVSLLARGLRPLLKRIFPEVPADHPAMGSMLMNMAANMLGLGNAATPLGLRAMKDLESLNPRPGTASNSMCTFLAINTSSIQLIPVTAIAILAANKSVNPTAIVGTTIMATSCAATSAILMAKFLEKLPWFKLPPLEPGPLPSQSPSPKTVLPHTSAPASPQTTPPKEPIREAAGLAPMKWWGKLSLSALFIFFICLFVKMAFPGLLGGEVPPASAQSQSLFVRIIDTISKLSIPLILASFPLYAALRKVKVYEEFVDGAKEGFDVAIRIIPYLVAILVAIGMFRAAGGIDLLSKLLAPAMSLLKFPSELLPLVLMRPLSGSGTLGIFTELVRNFGPDSLLARTAGTIFGSTETTFYVLAVYFGSVGIKRTRHAVIAGLTGDFTGVVMSIIVCKMVFA